MFMTHSDFFEEEFSYDLFKDLSYPRIITPMEENVFGTLLDSDLSKAHITEDPLIKHYAEANHFLNHNMSLRRTRFALKVKFFFKDAFSRKPKAKKPKSAKSKRRKSKRK